MKTLISPPMWLCTLVLAAALAAAPAAASASSFMEYCQSTTSKAGKHTLKVIAEVSKTSDCAKMEAHLKGLESLKLDNDELTDLTALSFFDQIQTLTLHSEKAINLSTLGKNTNIEAMKVRSPIKSFPYIGDKLEQLDISNAPMVDLAVLAKYPALQSLILYATPIADYSQVNKLNKLLTLWIAWGNLESISQISNLTNLEVLDIPFNDLESLAGIEKMTTLQSLTIDGNHVSDISAIGKLTELLYLDLSYNPVKDFSPLKSTPVAFLQLNGLHISDLSIVANFPDVAHLTMRDNEISDLTPLSTMSGLEALDVSGNLIRDLSPISKLELTDLAVTDNYITEVPKISADLHSLDLSRNFITSLEGLDVAKDSLLFFLGLNGNRLQSLKGVEALTNLGALEVSSNKLQSLAGLAALAKLKRIYADNNRIWDAKSLVNLTNLRRAKLNNNKISTLAPIADSYIEFLWLDNNPLGYQFKRYASNCPKDAHSDGVGNWCKTPIKRIREGGTIIGKEGRVKGRAAAIKNKR